MAAVGHLLICSQVGGGGEGGGGGGGVQGKKTSKWHTGGVVPFAQCLTDFSANLLSHQHLPPLRVLYIVHKGGMPT